MIAHRNTARSDTRRNNSNTNPVAAYKLTMSPNQTNTACNRPMASRMIIRREKYGAKAAPRATARRH